MKEVNPQKVNLLLVNKADMLTTEQRFVGYLCARVGVGGAICVFVYPLFLFLHLINCYRIFCLFMLCAMLVHEVIAQGCYGCMS